MTVLYLQRKFDYTPMHDHEKSKKMDSCKHYEALLEAQDEGFEAIITQCTKVVETYSCLKCYQETYVVIRFPLDSVR